MVDITVAIPTYNGEKRLGDVLDRLKRQVGTEYFSWEAIVVDNNSTDNTAKLVREYQAQWPAQIPLRYCFAGEQGAAFARQRAVEKANGKLIGFLDDDNLPEPNWVAAAYEFSQNHPEVGAFGSQIHGYFYENTATDKVPDSIKRVACFLAIIERGDKPHRYDPRHKILPPGAGVVVRKEAWEKHVPPRLFLNHKGKDAGLASEDLEALLHIQNGGWDIWYNPAMVVRHKIPNVRLEKDYLIMLVRCVGLSRHRLRMMTLKSWQKPLAFPAYLANDLRRLVLHAIKYRPDKVQDTATACERELLTSSVMSPWFLWKHQWLNSELGDRATVLQTEASARQIAEAFEEERFRLHSQRVYPLNGDRAHFEHSEILLRLEDKTGKLRLPGEFLPPTERHNLMRTIDRWAIRTLCEKIANIGTKPRAVLYEINLSEASVNDEGFVDFLQGECAFQNVSPKMLCFAISERTAIANLEKVARMIRQLKAIGCQVTLDRVGHRGYRQEALEKLSVDYLKIDGNLVKSVLQDPRNCDRLQKINQVGQNLGMKTIAHCVETPELLETTKNIGFNYAQGFGIARPTPFGLTCQLPLDLHSLNWKSVNPHNLATAQQMS